MDKAVPKGALDPQVRAILDALAKANFPSLELLEPWEARLVTNQFSRASASGPDVGKVADQEIAGRFGPIALRLYWPKSQARGLIVYYHGGGWVLGNLESIDAFARILVARTGCALVSVDYRLAPEHRFPAAVEDAVDAFRWCSRNCISITGRRAPLILAGDSAGANLATVTAMLAPEESREVGLQVLFYPVTDGAMDTASYQENGTGFLLTREQMSWFWDHYDPDKKARRDFRAAPLQAKLKADLPAAFIQTAEFDPLRDEGEAYARRLAGAGVTVTLQRRRGLIHGYIAMTGSVQAADLAVNDAVAAIKAICN